MGILEILLRLAWKADDDVGCQADRRLDEAQLAEEFQEPGAGVAAAHGFEDAVAAALDGDMGALAELGRRRRPRRGRSRNPWDVAR